VRLFVSFLGCWSGKVQEKAAIVFFRPTSGAPAGFPFFQAFGIFIKTYASRVLGVKNRVFDQRKLRMETNAHRNDLIFFTGQFDNYALLNPSSEVLEAPRGM
jgi:hypothetical protein